MSYIWIVGNGAREQAIKTACEKSLLCKSVELISEDDCRKYLQMPADTKLVDIIIFGFEQPICDGLVDEFTARGIKCIGVDKKFSQLESSKLTAKKFIVNHGIKCAKLLPIESNDFPQVLKFDGLCKGKGVKVLYNNDEKNAFARKFTGMRYFIEEYLEGEEISVMSYLYNGRLINFRPARDFKRLSAAQNAGTGLEITMQVGINSGEDSKISFNIDYTIGRIDINVLTSANAKRALASLDNYLKQISELQTDLGSNQNRLESAIESLGISIENLTSSQSTIRDADIAKESSEYIKMQILQQASATLLATANQTPSIALQLL